MMFPKVLLIALCLHAVCGWTNVSADDDVRAAELDAEALMMREEEAPDAEARMMEDEAPDAEALDVEAPMMEEEAPDAEAPMQEGEELDPALMASALNASQHSANTPQDKGKYFWITSRINPNLCMEPRAISNNQRIVMRTRSGYNRKQMWTYDRVLNVFRNILNDAYVMRISGSYLVLYQFISNDASEIFGLKPPRITYGLYEGERQSLGIVGGSSRAEAGITFSAYLGSAYQDWNIVNMGIRHGYIRNRYFNQVWSVASDNSGALVQLKKKVTGSNQQLWWEDSNGLIHSVANGEIVSIRSDGNLHTSPDGDGQEWVKSGIDIVGLHTNGHRGVLRARSPYIVSAFKTSCYHNTWYFDYEY